MKKISNKQPAYSDKGPIIVETDDPFDDLDVILGDYANTRKEINGKDIIVHVGNSFIVENVVDYDMLYETEVVGPMGNFKKVEVDTDNETEEESVESDTEENDTSGSDLEDLDYDPKHDEVFDDDEHILEDVHVHEHDLDVIDYDSFGSNLDDGIDSKRRTQLRKLRRIGKSKNQGLNKYYCYLGQKFATKEIVKGRVKKHLVETRRKLILILMKADEREDLGIEVNYNYTFISDRKKGLIQDIASVFPSAEHRATTVVEFNKKMAHLTSYNSTAYDWLIKFLAEQWSRSHFSGKATRVKVVQVKLVVLVNKVKEQDRLLVQGMSLVKLLVLVNNVKQQDKLLVQGMPQVKLVVLVNRFKDQDKVLVQGMPQVKLLVLVNLVQH
ncbi:hypothetical protein Tco_0882582 [Tanacetum coccineum]